MLTPLSSRRPCAPRRWCEALLAGERPPPLEPEVHVCLEDGGTPVETVAQARRLIAWPHWERVRDLTLSWNAPFAAGERALLEFFDVLSQAGVALRSLALERPQIAVPTLEALIEAPWFSRLERLSLARCFLTDDHVEVLSRRRPRRASLRALDLSSQHGLIGRRGLERLMGTRSLPELARLELRRLGFDSGAREILAAGALGSRLQQLDLSANHLTSEDIAALRAALPCEITFAPHHRALSGWVPDVEAELREILELPADADSWQMLLDLLSVRHGPTIEARIIPALLRVVDRWPSRSRASPWRWLVSQGEEKLRYPGLALCAQLLGALNDADDCQQFHDYGALLQSVERIGLDTQPGQLRRLLAAPTLTRLRVLDVIPETDVEEQWRRSTARWRQRSRAMVAELQVSPIPAALEELDLRGLNLTRADYDALLALVRRKQVRRLKRIRACKERLAMDLRTLLVVELDRRILLESASSLDRPRDDDGRFRRA